MNPQPNTPASLNEAVPAAWLHERADELVKRIHARIGTWGEQRKAIIDVVKEAIALAAPGAAIDAREQERGGELGMVESHPNYVAGFKAGHAAGRKRATPSEALSPATVAQSFLAVQFSRVDAERYCAILRLLGMEEEGDPLEEVERLIAQSCASQGCGEDSSQVTK